MTESNEKKILILGGGFAGVKCALELQKKGLGNVKITLVSDRPHFEYHGALYRLVAGHSPLEVCIPINQIIDEKRVDFSVDTIVSIDPGSHEAKGESGSVYQYDTLVIALGAETNFFNIPGLKEYSFGMKTISNALALKRHIHEVIESCIKGTKADNLCAGNFVVVGGGATGVEIAAELAVYTKKLAKIHGIEPTLMNVELLEAGARILPILPVSFTGRIEEKIRSLGVNVLLNRAIEKSDIENAYLNDMQLKTKTVIWTAGVRANHLIEEAGFPIQKTGKAEVDEHMHIKGHGDIFVSGDAAATDLSGMAQTALYDGEYIADVIEAELLGRQPRTYSPRQPIYAIPAGPGWAGTLLFGSLKTYGKLGWFLRRVVDMVVFLSLLPPKKAFEAFGSHKQTCEACPVCCAYEEKYAGSL